MKTLAKMLVICCWCMCTFSMAADKPEQQPITPETQYDINKINYIQEKAERTGRYFLSNI